MMDENEVKALIQRHYELFHGDEAILTSAGEFEYLWDGIVLDVVKPYGPYWDDEEAVGELLFGLDMVDLPRLTEFLRIVEQDILKYEMRAARMAGQLRLL